MGREEQMINERLKKISELKESGVNPYPYKLNNFETKQFSSDLKQKYENLKNEEFADSALIAGRIMAIRNLGKIAFAKLQDFKGTIQFVLRQGDTPDDIFKLFKKIDVGDIVGVTGKVFRTQRGELSVMVENIELLTKAVLPLPEKWHGLKDDEEKLRKRYLDIIMDNEIKEMFIKKSKFWQTTRSFLIEKGFLEVETPILENSAGGASATPFETHHNAMDIDVFLRISMGELWQKKLLVAGYEKTFEIGRQFRNEGMDMEHLQDYTQMEFYWGYVDFNDGMKLVEEMYKKIAKEVLGTLEFEYREHKVNLGDKWELYDYESLIKEKTGIDIYKASREDMINKLNELKMEFDANVDKWRLIDVLWKYCRKSLSGPGFLINQPVEISPLAKRSKKDNRKVEQFQVIIAGSEVGNGYSELNDPIDQEERFKEQMKLQEAGDSEAQDHDFEFVEALKYGMPPACGFGMSERFFAFLMNKSLRECVAFPLMRPEGSKAVTTGKANKSQIAVAVINKGLKLATWEEMNTVAHLNASLASRKGRSLLMQDLVKTKDGHKLKLNIQHAIMIKEAKNNNELVELIKSAQKQELDVFPFTREMIETTDDRKVVESTKEKDLKDIDYLGVLVFGKKTVVENLTKEFELVE
jgi:lysyl-tRNA synthetase, class II